MVPETADKNQIKTVSPGQRAKIRMIERGLTVTTLAAQIGLSRQYVYGLLSGHVATQAGRQKISDALYDEIWPGIVPASRTSAPQARGAVEQEQTNAVNPGDHEKQNADTEQEAGTIK